MSLRWRLIGGIVLLLSALWTLTSVWFFIDVRSELRGVLDERLASSAEMVQALLRRGDLELPAPGQQQPEPPLPLSASLPTDITCQLWTTGGRLLSAASTAPRLAADAIPDGFTTRTVAGQSWRIYALTDPEGDLRILTSEPLERRAALLRDVGVAVTIPFLVILPIAIGMVWLGVRRGLRPLERLRRAVKTRDAESLEPLRADDVPAEVSPFVAALNGLFDRLGQAFQRERRFTADAAHELRTPLAGIKAQLQIVRAADGPARERALAYAESGLDRMSRLVDQMLMLARLEAGSTGSGDEQCDPAEVAREVARELQPALDEREVELSIHTDTRETSATLPSAMLHTALRNLLENALRASPSGGHIAIDIVAAPLCIRVVDEGPGLTAQERERVVERFYRSKSEKGTGSGLGLHIVVAIADRYGLRLQLENRQERQGLVASLARPG